LFATVLRKKFERPIYFGMFTAKVITMPRTYCLDCPIARTLDVIGDRWAILILRDLFRNETRRFQDFESALPGLTPSVLSARLKHLESKAIITSRRYVDHRDWSIS